MMTDQVDALVESEAHSTAIGDQLLPSGSQGYCQHSHSHDNSNESAHSSPEWHRPQQQQQQQQQRQQSQNPICGSATLRSTTSAYSNQTASTTITANAHDDSDDDGEDSDASVCFRCTPSTANVLDAHTYVDDAALRHSFKGTAPELYSAKQEFIHTQPLVEKQLVLKKTFEWSPDKTKYSNMSTHWRQHAWLPIALVALCVACGFVFLYSDWWPIAGQSNATRDGAPDALGSLANIKVTPMPMPIPIPIPLPMPIPTAHTEETPVQFINDIIVDDKIYEDDIASDDIGDIEDIGNDKLIDYVTPIKVLNFGLNPDDLLYESKRNSNSNNSQKDYFSAFSMTGTFRSKSSQIWDPHPEYRLLVFGRQLHLVLHQDISFIPSETFRVIRILDHATEESDAQEHFLGCYYKGYVQNDKHSLVAVSLCNGMTGYIKTSFGSLLIQPVNKTSDSSGASGEIQHRVWRHSQRNARHAVSDFDLDLEAMEAMQLVTSDTPKLARQKRHNVGNQVYTLEVLIAVDGTMTEFHKHDLTSYILTLFSIVSNIFSDASIGNSIHISLVKLLKLPESITFARNNRQRNSTSDLLKHFCTLLPRKDYHYDTAMLITRDEICGNDRETKCHTLGLAGMGTACNNCSCSIVQDNGLPAAFTIAHELGHILNMPHDDDERCQALNTRPGRKRALHIMSSVVGDNMHPWSWSKCSQHYVSEFLEKADKHCLENTPTTYIPNPNTKQPGEIYSLDHQCQLIHGNQSQHCYVDDECKRLWCMSNKHNVDGCRSSSLPWADGTPCNNNRHWCQKGKCVPHKSTSLQVVNGGWGPWNSFTLCSLTCGGGVQESRRECNNPLPQNGGKFCVGSHKKYRSCNTQSCPPGTMDLREVQCYNMNKRPLNISGISSNVKWVPKYGLNMGDKCKLFCRLEDDKAYFMLAEKVTDGTTCSLDTFDKCVNGFCRPAGCDNELNSIAKLDKCGVCEGRNDTCEEYTGNFYVSDLFKQKKPITSFYYVTTIPKGAFNIVITQPGYTQHNYIALSDDRHESLLNGNRVVQEYRKKVYYADVAFDYNGSNSPIERVNTTFSRKLKRDLIVEIISIDVNAGKNNDTVLINYTYTMDKPNYYMESELEIYRWEMQAWSNCDSLCQGTMHRMPTCVSTTQGLKVAPQFCDETAKPKIEYRNCNTDCILSLNVSSISECSASCGQLGTREKVYNCLQTFTGIQLTNIVDMSYCKLKFEIIPHEPCREGCWKYTDWSTCSKTCGTGAQSRGVHCFLNQSPVSDELCNQRTKDELNETLRTCNIEPCRYHKEAPKRSVNNWMTGEWGECNDWCKKERDVRCNHPAGYGCSAESKPKKVRNCCQIKYVNEWTKCSVECGTGVKQKVQYCARVYKPDVPGTPKRRVFVNDSYCMRHNARRPPLRKNHKVCKINCKWTMSEWTQCPADCADDYQTRYVSCEVWQGNTVDERYCDRNKMPPKRRICNNCVRRESKVVSPCNCDGYERRRVFCYDSKKRRISCPTKHRVEKVKCMPPRECTPQSCADLQRMHRVFKDGEYGLTIRSRVIRIYCHHMNSVTPREYITVNPQENYSIFYEYRTNDPDRCPPQSRAHEYQNSQNSGRTNFHRVRVNITNLRIIENDFEFAQTVGAQRQDYGSAGDCYNRKMACPQGDFSINLEHTGFIMRPGTIWNCLGSRVVMQKASGFDTATTTRRASCGGYCGRCSISRIYGLYLDVL